MIPEWARMYGVAILIGGLAGSVGRAILDEIRLTRLVREKLGPYRPRPVRWVIKRGLTILLTTAMVLLCLLFIGVIWILSPPVMPPGIFP
jgi:hypothetical protein